MKQKRRIRLTEELIGKLSRKGDAGMVVPDAGGAPYQWRLICRQCVGNRRHQEVIVLQKENKFTGRVISSGYVTPESHELVILDQQRGVSYYAYNKLWTRALDRAGVYMTYPTIPRVIKTDVPTTVLLYTEHNAKPTEVTIPFGAFPVPEGVVAVVERRHEDGGDLNILFGDSAMRLMAFLAPYIKAVK